MKNRPFRSESTISPQSIRMDVPSKKQVMADFQDMENNDFGVIGVIE